ncbi:hypothetical protein I7I53_08521 [Histoplasma capsulatum var. duboisii H88]|uniref:Uncharacterized protein n=1 Tax=Ajellomyces capsulatus (strain H88) TaxID=544711 RepID=A0A8A1LIL8_AJEC8|nr:hypothetical protein I7I53_08521 [Histoplasma capsulatum var. duboisii H88]
MEEPEEGITHLNYQCEDSGQTPCQCPNQIIREVWVRRYHRSHDGQSRQNLYVYQELRTGCSVLNECSPEAEHDG